MLQGPKKVGKIDLDGSKKVTPKTKLKLVLSKKIRLKPLSKSRGLKLRRQKAKQDPDVKPVVEAVPSPVTKPTPAHQSGR